MFETTRRHLYLAGFMGTGKSVIGHAVATRLNRPFIDLDAMVVALRHHMIGEIFRDEGEAAFRHYESKALRLAVIAPSSVIALGGGTLTVKANANIIRATGHVVLLTANWEEIWNRVRARLAERPMLIGLSSQLTGDNQSQLQQFVAHAQPLYEKREREYSAVSDWMLDTSSLSVDEAAEAIVAHYED